MKSFFLLAALVLLCGIARADKAQCLADYRAEQARIERDAATRAPAPGSDARTQQQFMQSVNAALQAAAERASQCEQAGRPRPGSTAHEQARQREQLCLDASHQQAQEMLKRTPTGRSMTLSEQQARRAEEDRIVETRMACLRRAR